MNGISQSFDLKSQEWLMLVAKIIVLALISIISINPSISFAQGGVQAYMEEVQVVARKKSSAEAIQDVPLAVSAFSGDQIEATFVRDLQSLSFAMPNVSLEDIGTIGGTANFSIRGLGVNSSIPSEGSIF